MKNQKWTIIGENSAEKPKKSPRKNRKISIVLASAGVFLMLVGAVPFFLDGKKSGDFSAMIATESAKKTDENFVAEATPVDENFDLKDLPAEKIPEKTEKIPEKPKKVSPPKVQNHAAAPAKTPTFVAEKVNFPKNSHTGKTVAPQNFQKSPAPKNPNFHAAAPKNPKSGAPIFPILAISVAAAAFFRRRQK